MALAQNPADAWQSRVDFEALFRTVLGPSSNRNPSPAQVVILRRDGPRLRHRPTRPAP